MIGVWIYENYIFLNVGKVRFMEANITPLKPDKKAEIPCLLVSSNRQVR